MNNLKIGSFLQALRKAKGLTQAELAEYFEISAKTISKWECGDSLPEIPMLKALADYYDVSVDEILNGERGIKKEEEKNRTKNEKFFLDKKMKKLNLVILLSFSILSFGFLLLLIVGYTAHRADIAFWVSTAIYFISGLCMIFGLYMVGGVGEEFSEKNRNTFKNKKFWFWYIYGWSVATILLMSFLFYYLPSSVSPFLTATLSISSALLMFLFVLLIMGVAAGIYPFLKFCPLKIKKLVLYFIYSIVVLLLLVYLSIALLAGEVYYEVGDGFKNNYNLLNSSFNAATWVGYGLLIVGFIVTLLLTIFKKYHLLGYGISAIALLLLAYGISSNLPLKNYYVDGVFVENYYVGSVFETTICFLYIFLVLLAIESIVRIILYVRKRRKIKN